jgi:DNA-binding response OmpR family regulator
MPAKKKRSRASLTTKNPTRGIADGEIDVLKFLVKSTLANKSDHGEALTEATFGHLRVDFVRHELFKNGKRLIANAREFELLKYFLSHEGEVVSRDQLLTDVWGFEETPNTRSVDNYILTLRKKIEDDTAHPKHILTFRGAGYKFIR